MKKCVRYTIYVITAIILIVVIPIVINELYKTNSGYVTIWDAADVLNYYGTVLGACVAVGALIITIAFTKRQIQRDSFIKNQEEKWNRIDDLVSGSLVKIHPTRIAEIISKASSKDFGETISALHLFSFQAKTALDSLFGYISGDDYKLLESLLLTIQDEAERYCGVAMKLSSQYQKLIQLEIRKNAIQIQKTAQQNPTMFNEDLQNSQRILGETADLNEKEVFAEMNVLSGQLSALRDNSYRALLEKKRSKFIEIHDQWTKEADSILGF